MKHEWKLAYVTPLYRFQHAQLKSYSKHLAAFIVAEKQQGVAVEVGLEAGFKVTLSNVNGLAETEDDAGTVFIQVKGSLRPRHYITQTTSVLSTSHCAGCNTNPRLL